MWPWCIGTERSFLHFYLLGSSGPNLCIACKRKAFRWLQRVSTSCIGCRVSSNMCWWSGCHLSVCWTSVTRAVIDLHWCNYRQAVLISFADSITRQLQHNSIHRIASLFVVIRIGRMLYVTLKDFRHQWGFSKLKYESSWSLGNTRSGKSKKHHHHYQS